MTYRVDDARLSGPRAGRLALAALAALLATGPIEVAAAGESTCTTCAIETRLSHLDALFGDDPTRGRIEKRLDDKPWIAQNRAALPVVVKPSDQSLDMAASLQHIGYFEAWRLQEKINDAKPLAPKALALPKPIAVAPPPLDVWSRVEVSGIDSVAGESRRGTVGADYRLNRAALVGLSAGVVDEPAVVGSDTRLAAYFAAKPWAPLTFDAKAQWGEAHTADPTGGSTAQSAVSARLTGKFSYYGVKVAPALSIAHGVDEAAEAAGNSTIEKTTIALTPRISQPFVLQGGGRWEPFLSLKSAVDFGDQADSAQPGVNRTNGVGAGFTIAEPNAYSLSVTTGIEQTTSDDKSTVSGKLELKVPLK